MILYWNKVFHLNNSKVVSEVIEPQNLLVQPGNVPQMLSTTHTLGLPRFKHIKIDEKVIKVPEDVGERFFKSYVKVVRKRKRDENTPPITKRFKIPKLSAERKERIIEIVAPVLKKATLNTRKTQKTHIERFGELVMSPFPSTWAIPDQLRTLDENTDHWMDILLKLGRKKSRLTEKAYGEYLSTCLYLEEIEEELRFSAFNINKIRLEYVANDTFRFEVNDQFSKLIKAMEQKLVKNFTLELGSTHRSRKIPNTIFGRIGSNRSNQNFDQNHQYIYVNLHTDEEVALHIKEHCLKNLYDMRFHGNRTTYIHQHHAVFFVEIHQLFDCLVNNSLLNTTLPELHINHENYDYW